MKKKTPLILALLSLLLVFVTGFQTMPVISQPLYAAEHSLKAQTMDQADSSAPFEFELIDSQRAWLSLEGRLYLSENKGQTWKDISPKIALEAHKKVAIHQDGQGLILSVSLYDETVLATVLKTKTYGKDWQKIESNLQFVLLENHAGPISELYMQWLSPDEGWLLAKRASGINFSQGVLLHTKNGGVHWTAMPSPAGERFVFIDSKIGFMYSPGETSQFYYTTNGGKDWQDYVLPGEPLEQGVFNVKLPVMLKEGGLLLPMELQFEDGSRQAGFYYSETVLPDFSLQGAFTQIKHTADEAQKRSAKEVEIDALQLNLDSISFVNKSQGWALFEGGNCQEGKDGLACRYTRELKSTQNGGKTWQAIPLPSQSAYPTRSFKLESDFNTFNENQLHTGQVGIYQGHFFDACNIPTLAQLSNWFSNSPYRGVNLYIGGISRLCSNTSLNKEYITEIARQGWRLVPTWVGHQPPCTGFKRLFPYDVDEAYNYGVDNANQAKARMQEFGLLDSNGKGGIVYLDLEFFSTSNTACVAASRAYVRGWTTRMNELGIKGGLYASSSNLNKARLFDISPAVPAVWIAEWSSDPGYNAYASPYNLRHLPNGYWTSQQRLRQYSGPKKETWGGVTLNIDPNVADGPVMALSNLPPSKPNVSASLSGDIGISPWYKSQVNVFINAYDYGSGIKAVYRRIDDGDWKAYQPFGVNGTGLVKVSFYAINNAGLQSEVKTISFYVDNLPPLNPRVKSHGCNGLVNGIPQANCNDANFVMSAGYDAGIGLHPTETYQYYWGTNPNGVNQNTSSNLLHFDPNPIPKGVPYYLRVRSQDKHNRWSAWQTIFVLHYDPDFTNLLSFPYMSK